MGYGYPLQGCCLEGFDFLGFHQVDDLDVILSALANVQLGVMPILF